MSERRSERPKISRFVFVVLILGRAGSIGAYVKRGEESGYIKITLRGETKEEQIIITRNIDTSNKSEWLFNWKVVPKKDVIEVVQRFNIQVNNLTQAVDSNKEALNQLKTQHAEQERDVERVCQRELITQVELMKKKLPWLKYDLKKADYMEAKKQEADVKRNFDEAAKILDGLKVPIEKQKQEKAQQESKCKDMNRILADNARRRKQLQDNENQWGVQVAGKRQEMQELKRQEKSCHQRILRAKDDLAAAELELANLPIYEPPKDEICILVFRKDWGLKL